MLTTHGGSKKGKRFEWAFHNDDRIFIQNENERRHEYSLDEVFSILQWLTKEFDAGWFPLANNVEKLGLGEEINGLGVAILQGYPDDIAHAQGSSYLGVVLEHVGILEWNKQSRGIKWRIIRPIHTLDELRQVLTAKAT